VAALRARPLEKADCSIFAEECGDLVAPACQLGRGAIEEGEPRRLLDHPQRRTMMRGGLAFALIVELITKAAAEITAEIDNPATNWHPFALEATQARIDIIAVAERTG
jgi:hypothetical protein